jgi:hypothetical protein
MDLEILPYPYRQQINAMTPECRAHRSVSGIFNKSEELHPQPRNRQLQMVVARTMSDFATYAVIG